MCRLPPRSHEVATPSLSQRSVFGGYQSRVFTPRIWVSVSHESGLTTQRRDNPLVQKTNGKTGRGDLLIKDANIGGNRHLV
jgi:hypothetical protein